MGSRLESGSNATRKRIENHVFTGEDGEEYEGSSFGGFGEYFRRKKLKLQNLDSEIRSSSPNNPPIFRGVVAHVNGYTQPSLNDLHRMIVSHGGGFLQYLDGKTAATHIIASSLTPKKREDFKNYRIVKPAWVVESIKAGRLLPWDDFRVVDEGQSQKVLKFGQDGRITSQSNSQQLGYRDQTDTSWYTSQLQQTIDGADERATPEKSGSSLLQEVVDNLPQQTPRTPENIPATIKDKIEDTSGPFPPKPASESPSILQGAPAERITPTEETASPSRSRKRGIITDASSMTPEEYNAHLLSDPTMRNNSVVNPEFIQQFYGQSRLHHLSTWKAELKAQLQGAAQEKRNQMGQKQRVPGARRYIMHVDFDCFFAAVSVQKHPQLVGKPVAVAHGTGSGSEIASCNYVAREFGIKNGMWMRSALQACPDLKVVSYEFDAYEDASRKFYDAILSLDGVVQSVSIDEALVDITNMCLQAGGSDGRGISEGSIYREQAKADEVAQTLRDRVKEKTGCDVSVGIGGNILQAKVALRKAKPAGQFQLKPDAVLEFIGNLTAQDLPGVAYSLGAKLEELGVKFVKDIRELTKERLVSNLGPKTGAKLWDYARGIDRVEVGQEVIRKSVSAEINWGIRFVTQAQAEEFVQSLCDELHRRLMENLVKGKQLTMRIMRRSADAPLEPVKHLGHGKCDTFNKSVALGVATYDKEIIGREAVSILRGFNISPGDLRGLGVQMTKLEPLKQQGGEEQPSSQRQLNFKASPAKKALEATSDPDEINSPRKGDVSSQYLPDSLKAGPALNDSSQKPLNITGTQFVMPSQPDPAVLAELPKDIRSKFATKPKPRIDELFRAATPQANFLRSASPSVTAPDLPTQSQLDPATLDELPDDVRAEVLSYYRQAPQSPPSQAPTTASAPSEQPPPPQRPAAATFQRPKKVTTPTKPRAGRGRGRPPSSRTSANSTLTQSSFNFTRPTTATTSTAPITSTTQQQQPPTSGFTDDPDEISPDFLAALPPEIRHEVLEEHKRARLQRRSGLNLPPSSRRPAKPTSARPPDQKRLTLPPRPEKPTFTAQKLSEMPQLRGAMGAWYEEFKDEGPYEEDVAALVGYLGRVVGEERDVAKAVGVVEWLGWLVRDGEGDRNGEEGGDEGDDAWKSALKRIQEGVNKAVKGRGMPPVEFG